MRAGCGRALTALVILLASACDYRDDPLLLAVTTEEPAPTLAESISATLATTGIDIATEITPNATEAIEAIADGRVDLAILEEPALPLPGMRTLAPLYPSVLHVLHRLDADPAGVPELVGGSKVYAGPEGSAGRRLLLEIAADFDLPRDAFELLDDSWTASPDVFFIFGGLLSRESIRQLGGYRMFSFGDGEKSGGTLADAIALRHHHVRPFVLPQGIYPALANDTVLTLATRTVLATSQSFDDDTAYGIAAALFTGARELSLSYPLVTRELSEAAAGEGLMLPLHQGTRRYLMRDRPGFLERNAELMALCFTVLATVGSGLLAFFRYRSQTRKDRVDAFYGRLLDIRRQLLDGDGGCDYAAGKEQVLQIQGEVLGLLIDERIAADSSLVAFISLSNQVLNEFDRFAAAPKV